MKLVTSHDRDDTVRYGPKTTPTHLNLLAGIRAKQVAQHGILTLT
jgi:hypothetical protein